MGLGAYGDKEPLASRAHENVIKRFIPESETDLTAEKERPKEEKVKSRSSYAKDKDWKIRGSYRYDEWDTTISDYKSDWCTVNEVEPVGVSADYYRDASERYRNEIALIRRVFSRMRPEAFHRMRGQTDGTEVDIDAFIDALIDKKGGINPEDRLYIRWDKHERDVATLFLLDVSASTRKVLGMDGRSIVDVEKDALIVMIQALESIGDKYAIYAFSGNTREDVEYFVIKEFDEELSEDVARRISLLEPAANTRLGPAIRHSITKLDHVSARTKIMVLLSDGEPYDTCTGEGAYQGHLAEEDTRIAIQELRSQEMHFFCITVDNNPGEYLDNIFSDVGYTIIDDARVLPESLPLLYKRITT
jgi:nitric oxide reductase activation protein